MNLLTGKKAVILGLANDRSIAWGIAKAFKENGAELALTYQNEVMEKRVRPLAEQLGVKLVLPCDVSDDYQIKNVFSILKKEWGTMNILVHSLAYADKEELKGSILDTSRVGFNLAMETSVYSLLAVAREAHPLLEKNNSNILAMTYYGAEKVFPNYNVMGVAKAALESSVRYMAAHLGKDGIRVNAVSAGPIKTLASAGISGFKELGKQVAHRAPLQYGLTNNDVANSCLYMVSDLAKNVTGEIHFVDNGFNIMGF